MDRKPSPDLGRDEGEVVALAVALGAESLGGPLSSSERALVRSAEGRAPDPSEVDRVQAELIGGGDPLGRLFYSLRSSVRRRAAGAVYTPQSLIDPMVSWTLQQGPSRIVDAGSGSGRFAAAVAARAPEVEVVAIDLDPLATLMTRGALAALGHARSIVLHTDYTRARLPKVSGPTAFLGNPPYVRHHDLSPSSKAWAQVAARQLGRSISGLAGLHAYFYLATVHHGSVGDLGCFVTSAEWLDVNYGRVVRELLLEHLGGEAVYLIEPTSMPFGEAATTAAIACFRLGTRPPAMRFRGVTSIAGLPRLEGGHAFARTRLEAASRWTHFIRGSRPVPDGHVELGELCRVHRGSVTGSNAVWVRNREELDLPESVLFSSVTKARELFAAGDALESLDGLRVVVSLPRELEELDLEAQRRVKRFLRDARHAGAANGYIAKNRPAWWSVGLREAAPILATYMARRPPAFVRNLAEARHINIAHGLYPRVELAPVALDALARFLRTSVGMAGGRTYAGGLTKFEPREMERLPVPDVTGITA